jgi:hypothetical protein
LAGEVPVASGAQPKTAAATFRTQVAPGVDNLAAGRPGAAVSRPAVGRLPVRSAIRPQPTPAGLRRREPRGRGSRKPSVPVAWRERAGE